MAKSPERALVEKIASATNDPTFNFTLFADIMKQQHLETQGKMWKVVVGMLAAWASDFGSDFSYSPQDIVNAAEHLHASLIAYKTFNMIGE